MNNCSHCGKTLYLHEERCPRCGREYLDVDTEPSLVDRIGSALGSLLGLGTVVLLLVLLVTNWHAVSDEFRRAMPFMSDPVCARAIGFNNDAINRVNAWYIEMDERGQYRSWTNRDWEESISQGNDILTWLQTMDVPRNAESFYAEILKIVDDEIEILYALWYGDQSTFDRYTSSLNKADARLEKLQDEIDSKCNSRSPGMRTGG